MKRLFAILFASLAVASTAFAEDSGSSGGSGHGSTGHHQRDSGGVSDGNGGHSDDTPPPPTPEKVSYTCRIVQDADPSTMVSKDANLKQYGLFRVLCGLDASSTLDELDFTATSAGMPGCSVNSTTTCVEKMSIPNRILLTKTMKSMNIYFLLRNPNLRVAEKVVAGFFHLDLQPLTEKKVTFTGVVTGLTDGVSIGGGVKETSCQVYISGASTSGLTGATCSGQDCSPARAVPVEAGKLIFQAAVLGGVGDMAIPKSVNWLGGPEKLTGVWSTPPVGKDTLVTAVVTTKDNVVNYCSVKFNQYGKGYTLKLDKYGDCPYYRALRNYYHLNVADSAPQVGGYPSPLTIPGFQAKYGTTVSDIPFRGVLNYATDTDGVLKVDNGAIVIPPLAKRLYSNPIVVARRLNTKGAQSVGEAVYYGILNVDNYAETVLRPVGGDLGDENVLLVFQFFLAAKQEKTENGQVIDIRGASDGIPYHQFKDADAEGKPYDRLIPVVNDSCSPVFQIRAPARSDKPNIPKELQDAVTCAFSKPFKVGEFKAGRVRLALMHHTAEVATDQYPLDLIQGNLGAPTTSTVSLTSSGGTTTAAPTGDVACWIVNPASLGSPTWASGGGTSSSTTTKIETFRERVPGDECSTRLNTQTVNTTTTTALNGKLGFRYSYGAYAWGAAFGCAVTQNWPDQAVYGVVEQSTAYTGASYAAPLGAAQPHFDKVSCVRGTNNAGLYEAMVRNPIPLQSYAFSKSIGPAAQVRTQNFHVRPWGYDVPDLNSDAVGSFFAPMCPGSQFAYDNVSLSWSPLILDIKGKGIRLSRIFNRSIGFDIKGTGYLSYVDWPENTSEVAMLVLPDSQGRVSSIKELFGDDKFANGFEKLRSYDLNKDKRIDAHDAVYANLRLWFDRNRNGKVDKDELETLDKNGVQFITLEYGRPGSTASAEEKTLSGLYFNSQQQKFMNIQDHYFYEYVDSQRVKVERGAKGAKKKDVATRTK